MLRYLLLLLATIGVAGADDQWTLDAASMPTARKEINNATVVIGQEIVVVGGVASNGQITGALEIYDTLTDTWRTGAPLPVPVWRSSAVAIDGQLYVFGGYLSTAAFPFNPTANAWRYDPGADQWTAIASLPSARGSLVALALEGRAHVIGGATSTPQDLHQVYDPASDSWTSLAALPDGRSGLTGTVLDGELYITGGYILAGSVVPQADLFIYNPATGGWRNGTPLPNGRLGMDAATFRGRMLVFGGAGDAQTPSRTLEYDPATATWSPRADMPQPVSFMGVAGLGNQVYVLGGGATNLNRFDGLSVNRVYTPLGAEFAINGGLSGSWFNFDTAGQGILIEVLPALNQVFLAWFTFEEPQTKVGQSEHRWLTAQGTIEGNRSQMMLVLTSGGAFDAGQAVATEAVGNAVLEFFDCTHARFEYALDNDGPSGGFDLQRLAPDTLCGTLSATTR